MKYKENIVAKLFSQQSLHGCECGEALLTEGRLALRGCPGAGEGRGTGHAASIRQPFQRLPSSTVAKSRKPASSRRYNQAFKTFKGPSTIGLKQRENTR